MATSGTTTFDLSIEEIIQEAYERCGMTTTSGHSLRSARTSLNLLFAEWANRGIHLWKVSLHENQLVLGQAEYAVDSGVSDVLEAFVSTTGAGANTVNTQDVSLTKIDRSAYAALPNKLAKGQPSQYYVDRQEIPKIYLYQAPDLNTYTYLKYYVIKRIQDAGAYTNDADVVFRFLPCMVAGLAYYMAMKRAPERVQMLKSVYEEEFQRAADEDQGRTPLKLQPSLSYLRV